MLRRSTVRVLRDALGKNPRTEEGQVEVPVAAWIRAHRKLQIGLERHDVQGDRLAAPIPLVRKIIDALDVLHGNSVGDRRGPDDPACRQWI